MTSASTETEGARGATPVEDPLAVVYEVAPHLRATRKGDGCVYLVGELQRMVIRSPIHARLLTEANGRQTLLELIESLAPEFGDTLVMSAAEQLFQAGLLSERLDDLPEPIRAWWSAATARGRQSRGNALGAPVSITATDSRDLAWLVSAFETTGFRIEPDAPVEIVVTDDYLDPSLTRMARGLADAERAFLPVKATGRMIWLGPLFSPGEPGACWECLRQRVEINRPVEALLAASDAHGPVGPPQAWLPTTHQFAASAVAMKILEATLEPKVSPLREHLLTIELPSLDVNRRRVVRRPQCPRCGDADFMRRSIAAPMLLRSTPKLADQSGGHRTTTPESTAERCSHLIDPITGVLMRLSPVEGRDHPLRPVYGSGYHVRPPLNMVSASETFFRPTLGKGRTPAQARASAIAEGIERHGALWQGDEPHERGRLADFGGRAIAPTALLHFSDRQYDSGSNDPSDWRHRAPLRYSEGQVIDWTPCWSLTDNERRYLPSSYCFNYTPTAADERVCPFDTNGNAAGNCREEAILQGFLELVERDAVGIWWHNRLLRQAVDFASSGSEYLVRTQEHYRALGWTLWALDLTTDLGIPVIAAIAHNHDRGHFIAGFGCHLEPELALQRAVTEAHQIFTPGAPALTPWSAPDMSDTTFVFPRSDRPTVNLSDFPRVQTDDLLEDIQHCVAHAAARDLEVIVLDYTRPDLVLSTVKVVVPGLRHFWRRLGPGRLYEVPVTLGDFERMLDESQLNPLTLKL